MCTILYIALQDVCIINYMTPAMIRCHKYSFIVQKTQHNYTYHLQMNELNVSSCVHNTEFYLSINYK